MFIRQQNCIGICILKRRIIGNEAMISFYISPFNIPPTCQYQNCQLKSTQTSREALSGADLHEFRWSNVNCYELVLSEVKMRILLPTLLICKETSLPFQQRVLEL